jgi:hypothetical protein
MGYPNLVRGRKIDAGSLAAISKRSVKELDSVWFGAHGG